MVLSEGELASAGVGPAEPEALRLRRMVQSHISFVWRSLRRFGVPEADVDDAVQEVFLVASKRLEDVPAEKEQSFLYSTAVRVAANARRSQKRRAAAYERFEVAPATEAQPTPESLAEQVRAKELLATLLESLPDELREVFVLFEIEELGIGEIAEALDVPVGTVGSRLRRGRERFKAALARERSREAFRSKVTP